MALDILVVDDEPDIRELIAGVLGDEGYSARTADTAERALEEVRARTPRLVVLDVWLQGSGMDGLSLLKYLKSIDPILPVIVISGHGNIETAVAAIRRGARARGDGRTVNAGATATTEKRAASRSMAVTAAEGGS